MSHEEPFLDSGVLGVINFREVEMDSTLVVDATCQCGNRLMTQS